MVNEVAPTAVDTEPALHEAQTEAPPRAYCPCAQGMHAERPLMPPVEEPGWHGNCADAPEKEKYPAVTLTHCVALATEANVPARHGKHGAALPLEKDPGVQGTPKAVVDPTAHPKPRAALQSEHAILALFDAKRPAGQLSHALRLGVPVPDTVPAGHALGVVQPAGHQYPGLHADAFKKHCPAGVVFSASVRVRLPSMTTSVVLSTTATPTRAVN